jgi:purine-binding chemotaxis protein CheW
MRGRKRGEPRWLLVRSATSVFALPIAAVLRIVRSVHFFPVPGARAELLGLIQYGGEPVAVLDLATVALPGSESGGASALVVVVNAGPLDQPEQGEVVGLAVDEALTVTPIANRMISQNPEGIVRGEAMVHGSMVRCLELSALRGRHR